MPDTGALLGVVMISLWLGGTAGFAFGLWWAESARSREWWPYDSPGPSEDEDVR